ncbi:hypothetical protein PENANT_c024G00636 [Penicillium antarcticum]|uniref:Uncharacterized protein n=1 Tax=Penicillium antarcticum TaxID=416450 RepID=A0A1V6PYG5_9EURO|nr:uncharacterized protein N7508_005088 [Penicillium antarcticum]KAJ5306073.1 hypothetical protein N7508_005088 [Penicillium antarcticum]OQD82011.1 hypothetical protein PENANT_c024G00636 [Penicillium antarcticum]
MPSPEHGAATGALARYMEYELVKMGYWATDAITSYSGSGIRINDKGKDADFGWGRSDRPDEEGVRLTVAVEVGISEASTVLKRDIDFWLNPNFAKGNLVIAIKVHEDRAEIEIDSWELDQWDHVHRVAHLQISKGNKKGAISVCGDPLIISFENLVGRPRITRSEKDIIISKAALQVLAKKVSKEQKL